MKEKILVEDIIEEVEDFLDESSLKEMVKVWNKLFPEEILTVSSVRGYNKESIDELKEIIKDQLPYVELTDLLNIHYMVSENDTPIEMDDIINNFDDDFYSEEDEDIIDEEET
jgi:hypothetical protein